MFKNFFRVFGILCGIAAASSVLVDAICSNTRKIQKLLDECKK